MIRIVNPDGSEKLLPWEHEAVRKEFEYMNPKAYDDYGGRPNCMECCDESRLCTCGKSEPIKPVEVHPDGPWVQGLPPSAGEKHG